MLIERFHLMHQCVCARLGSHGLQQSDQNTGNGALHGAVVPAAFHSISFDR
jgi:hypothetical protein